MKLINAIGALGTFLLAICMLPELMDTVMRGECLMSLWTLLIWVSGLIGVAIYTYFKFGWDLILHINYILNVAIGIVLIWYKF